MTALDVLAVLALAWVLLVAVLGLVGWDEATDDGPDPDLSRGVLPPDAYAREG